MDETSDHVPTPNRSISGLLEVCRDSVSQYCQDQANGKTSLLKTLGRALELYRLSKATQEDTETLKNLMKDKDIRETKRTKNPYTPIVKLIFFEKMKDIEKSLVMRCAGVLRLADSNAVDPDDIAKFVTKQGGIVQCYKNDREAHPSAPATSTKPDPIEALRQNALKCTPTVLRQLVSGEPVTALLDVDQGGDVVLLGARIATSSEIRRYKVSTKSTAV